MTRAEHVRWCKERARAYLAEGDLQNAVASMTSDLSKHPETKAIVPVMGMVGLGHAMSGDRVAVSKWIEGFSE